MQRQRLIGCFIAIVSVGWLLPLWLGNQTYIDGQTDTYRLLLHVEHPINSFPFFGFAADCFTAAFVWLGIVGLAWSYALSVWLMGVLRPNNSFKPKPLRGSA
jgi:hypothetical protein